MRYALERIDVEDLPAELAVTGDGVGLVVRRRGRLVGFVMEPARGRGRLSGAEIADLLARNVAPAALAAAIDEELPRDDGPGRMPSLTVAICTRGRPDWVDRCLTSLERLDPGPAGLVDDFEILVVDNAPPDHGTRDVVARHAGVRYAVEPKPGLNFGRNRALAEARGTFIAYVDDDVVVDPGWLAGLARAWTDNPDALAFTGLVLPFSLDTDAQVMFEQRGGFRRGFARRRFCGADPHNPLMPCGAGSFGAGANMAFHRQTVRDIGGFDEALDTGPPLPGGGDLDMFYRMARTGAPFVYEPQYAVHHDHRREMAKLKHQYWTWGLAHMAFVVKSHAADAPRRRQFRKLVRWWFRDQFRQLARSLLRRSAVPADMVFAELAGGVVGLLGEYGRSVRRTQRIRERHR